MGEHNYFFQDKCVEMFFMAMFPKVNVLDYSKTLYNSRVPNPRHLFWGKTFILWTLFSMKKYYFKNFKSYESMKHIVYDIQKFIF